MKRFFHRLGRWLLFRRKAKPIVEAPAPEPATPEPIEFTAEEAAGLVIMLIANELRNHVYLPGNLNLVADQVWPAVPEQIRGRDTPVNRAEFAHVLHRAILYIHSMNEWMSEP